MYGKTFESMYEGSMVGAGIHVFAVWNYVITKARHGVIEINPKLLAFTLGGKEADIEAALEFLQRPDPQSRSKLEGGRRLVKEGQFQYRLVNWEHYQEIRNESDRREYNKHKQRAYRAKKANNGAAPTAGALANKKDLKRATEANARTFDARARELGVEIQRDEGSQPG